MLLLGRWCARHAGWSRRTAFLAIGRPRAREGDKLLLAPWLSAHVPGSASASIPRRNIARSGCFATILPEHFALVRASMRIAELALARGAARPEEGVSPCRSSHPTTSAPKPLSRARKRRGTGGEVASAARAQPIRRHATPARASGRRRRAGVAQRPQQGAPGTARAPHGPHQLARAGDLVGGDPRLLDLGHPHARRRAHDDEDGRRLDRDEPRLVLRAHDDAGDRFRALGRVLQGRRRAARPRPLAAAVQARDLGRDAVRRGRRDRHALLLGHRPGRAVPAPALRRGRHSRRDAGCGRLDDVPLRHRRLGDVCAARHGDGVLRLPLGHAAVDPRGALPAARQARARPPGRRHQHHRAGRHRVRRRHLDGHRRRPAERRLLADLRPGAGPRAADRAGHRRGGPDHRGHHVGRRPRHPLDLRAEPLERRGDDGLHPLHRPDGVPLERPRREHRPVPRHAPRAHAADLRLRARRRRVDGRMDAVLLGVLARLGAVRRRLPRPHLARAHAARVRDRGDHRAGAVRLHHRLAVRQLGPVPGAAGQHGVRRTRGRRARSEAGTRCWRCSRARCS